MKPTKQQKVLCAVLLAGAAAIAIDRLAAGTDDPTAAADATEYALPYEKAGAAAIAAPTLPAGSLAMRLRRLAIDSGIDPENPLDAFAPRGASAGAAPGTTRTPAMTAFQASHRLTGTVVTAGGGGHAMIDGRLVRVGQSIDGYRLVSIGFRKVAFDRGGVRYELAMSEAP